MKVSFFLENSFGLLHDRGQYVRYILLVQYLNTCKKNDGLNKSIGWNFCSKAVNAIFRKKRNLNNKCNSLKNNSCIDVIIRNGIAHVWEKVTEFHHTKIRIVIRVT